MNDLIGALAKDTPFGVVAALAIIALIYVSKLLLEEKNKEITDAKNTEEKVTLVLKSVDSTMQAILIDLKRHDEEADKKTKI